MPSIIPGWTRREDIVTYVVDCYAGLDEVPGSKIRRRVWIWEDGSNIVMGNTEAFYSHLCEKFGLVFAAGGTAALHALMRALGEATTTHKPHTRRAVRKEQRPPQAEQWVIGTVAPLEGE